MLIDFGEKKEWKEDLHSIMLQEEDSEVKEEKDLVVAEDQLLVNFVVNMVICKRLSKPLYDVYILYRGGSCDRIFPTIDRKMTRREKPRCAKDICREAQRIR